MQAGALHDKAEMCRSPAEKLLAQEKFLRDKMKSMEDQRREMVAQVESSYPFLSSMFDPEDLM
jgi:hypothetical protein